MRCAACSSSRIPVCRIRPSSPVRFTPGCSSSFPARWRLRTGIRKVRSASSSKAPARTPPSTASARQWRPAISSSRRRGHGTTTATTARSRSCGWTASTFPSSHSTTRSSPSATRKRSNPLPAPRATRMRGGGPTWRSSITVTVRGLRPCSTTRTRKAALPSRSSPPPVSAIRRTACGCATSTP